MRSRIKLFFILAACVVLLLGCTPNSNQWKNLADSAIELYGPATYVSHFSGNNSMSLTLKDETHGFTYSVLSTAPEEGIITFSDYENQLLQGFINEQADEIESFKSFFFADIIWNYPVDSNGVVARLELKRDLFLPYAFKFTSRMKAYDERDILHDARIEVTYQGKVLGTYYFGCNEVILPDNSDVIWYQNTLFMVLAYNEYRAIDSVDELVFTGKEYLSEEQLHELADFTPVYRVTDTPETLKHIPVFHYSFGDSKYVIANIIDANTMALLIFCE